MKNERIQEARRNGVSSGKLLLAAITALFLVNTGFAASDAVMLVTDLTSVDAATASAAAEKAGVPVLVLEDGLLNDGITSELQAQSYQNVILVGGPVVIKADVEIDLRRLGYNVVRIWGFERTGTAVAVARYFWSEGASCAVLVDDTKNSDEDSRRQAAAAEFAALHKCALVPVPEGTVPAEVLSLLKDLGVNDVHFVGKRSYAEVRDKMREFRLREIEGSDDKVEAEIDANITGSTRNPKLVIVATPDWKAAIARAAHSDERSVVRHVWDVSQVPEVVAFIQAHNITNVKVVGIPELAKQIADALQQSGINATVTPGRKASEISTELLKETKAEWEKKKAAEEANRLKFQVKIKAFLNAEINETLTRLDAVLAELDTLAQSAETDDAKAAIEAAKARITEVKNLLQTGNIDTARRLLFELKLKGDEKKFELRDKLRIHDEVNEEEGDLEEGTSEADTVLARTETKLAEIRQRCANADIIDAIIAKAKSLRASMQAAKESGNFTGASRHLVQVRELVKIAKNVAEACGQRGEAPKVVTDAMVQERLEIEKELMEKRMMEKEDMMKRTEPKEFTVEITNEGFSPRLLKVLKGDTVKWTNTAGTSRWPASAFHPTHKNYPGSDIAKCSDPEEKTKIFDSCENVDQGESYSFTFDQVGEWKYHDHSNPTVSGAINVVG